MIYQDGDILLCKSNGVVPWLIRWGSGSKYSHVAVVASANLGLVIEAVPEGGVRAISIENFKTTFDLFRVKNQGSYRSSEVVAYLIRMLARKYDFASAVRLGWKLTLRKLKLVQLGALKALRQKKAADRLQEDQDYFCSELCWRAFKAGGLDIVPQIGDGETTSPGNIADSPLVERINNS